VFFNFNARDPGNLSSYSEVLNVLQLRDPLTQLPNHQLFLEHLEQGVSIANRQKKFMVVIKLDIDKLSKINQQYGYKKGDQIIRNLAMRLTDLTRESDNVARLSGSEFGLILNLIEHDGEVDTALQRVMEEMRNPFLIENEDVILNISYGICVYPTEQGSIEDITQYASMALESAKKMGGNTHKYFDRV
jgi:diguanylate cyclase (GGDEF)-like protein